MFVGVKRIGKYKQLDKTKFILSITFINKKINHDHMSGWAQSATPKKLKIDTREYCYNNL